MKALLGALLPIIFLASGGTLEAAPCCAGSSSLPALITGDERAQFAASFSQGSVIGDAPNEGIPVFRGAGESETTQTLKLSGAGLLSDRSQVGVTGTFASRAFHRGSENATATALGDTSVGFAYEILPEWNYSAWRPRGHLFFEATLPTGRSVYEAERPGMVDATGRGFFRLAVGGVFTKRFDRWDLLGIGEIHRSLPRTFSPTTANTEALEVDAGFGASAAIGAGYSPGGGRWRFGIRLQPSYAEGRALTTSPGSATANRTRSRPVRVVDTSFEASCLLDENSAGTWTAFASYVDQTLLGPAANTTLNRVVSVGVQRRWDR